MKPMIFLPEPQSVTYTGTAFKAPSLWRVYMPERLSCMKNAIQSLWPELIFAADGQETATSAQEGAIYFRYNDSLGREAYEASVKPREIYIDFSEASGAFYAMMTLRQLLMQCDSEIFCCHIKDFPGLKLRGVLLDISRGKVPKLETLKAAADLLASVKINHLELYIEGFSFGYPSFEELWREEGALTAEEFEAFGQYCRERFIELTPHQNSLGHMAPWLSKEPFKALAEAPDGLSVMGMKFPPTTLDAADKGSLELVKTMIHDLASYAHSRYFHVGLDEAFEFGRGKNKETVKADGASALILPYIEALNTFLKDKGFSMIMWDDFLIKYPELIRKIPKDILVFDWGYDAEFPVEKRAEMLKESGLDFCLCPGTSSWSSFTGLTDNMLENIRRTGKTAYKYGAKGLMVTDWGDMNHFQYEPVNRTGILYGAAFAWNKQGVCEETLEKALNRFVYKDSAEVMGHFCLEAGRFYKQEEFRMPCRSLVCLPLIFGIRPKAEFEACVHRLAESVTFFSPEEVCEAYLSSYEQRKAFDGKKMYSFLNDRREELERAQPRCADAKIVLSEYKNSLKMLLYLTGIREMIECHTSGEGLDNLLDEILEEHEKLWRIRNKESGLKGGLQMFERLRLRTDEK